MNRFLPWLVLAVLMVTLVTTVEGCSDRACFQWVKSEGPCPKQDEALTFFSDATGCSDVKKILSGPTFIDGDDLCCYDVRHFPEDDFILCGTTTRTSSPTGSGGFRSSSSSSSFSTATRTSSSSPSTATSTFTSTTFTSSQGGFGGAAACVTCAQAFASGNNGNICSGPPQNAFAALSACVCGGACTAECQTLCSVGGAPDATCTSCIDSSCSSQKQNCLSH